MKNANEGRRQRVVKRRGKARNAKKRTGGGRTVEKVKLK